jgi:hypothetical protein
MARTIPAVVMGFTAFTLVTATPVPQASAAASAVPDLNGTWARTTFALEQPASGLGPLRDSQRRPSATPSYTSPNLKRAAAALVKERYESVQNGKPYATPSSTCWPMVAPLIFRVQEMQLLQAKDEVTLIYMQDHEVRRVRLNVEHPARLTPTWHGDSVGHYEGDTLVIDTVGVKTDRPYAMIDLFGTPYTDKLHVVERYRLRDYDQVKDAIERNRKENWLNAGDAWAGHEREKFLQLHVTVEDEGVFTTPWTATLTYAPADRVGEAICVENRHEYYNNKDSDVPKADKPDF